MGKRRWGWLGAAALALPVGCGSALAADGAPDRVERPAARGDWSPRHPVSVELVYFPEAKPVKLVRGENPSTPIAAAPAGSPMSAKRTEIVSFANSAAAPVTIVRGGPPHAEPKPEKPPQLALAEPRNRIETVNFDDPSRAPVTIVRGMPARPEPVSTDLFGPANLGELDRIAFAVDGIESRHGADPRMWRPEFDGPQGPMQVSAKAAIDVGGGDRFDLKQNRLLGRAYLERMYRRYGNWPDALAAYNWGPGNLDQWIASGRNPEQLPLETQRYITRVLHDALVTAAARL